MTDEWMLWQAWRNSTCHRWLRQAQICEKGKLHNMQMTQQIMTATHAHSVNTEVAVTCNAAGCME